MTYNNRWYLLTCGIFILQAHKRLSSTRHGLIKPGIRRGSTLQRGSVSSTPSGSQSQLNLSGSGSVVGAPPGGVGSLRKVDHAVIPEDGESVSIMEQEEEYTKERSKKLYCV